MAIYHDLDNTGQEVQQRLDQVPVTQADLAEEVLARQAAVGAVQNNVDAEELRAKAAEKLNADDIDAIEEKIPSGASSSNKMATASDISSLDAAIEAILLLIPSAATSLNKLADKAFVNSSIATATATFRGTKNLVSDLNLAVDATHEQIAVALSEAVSGADNNDYAFVQVPTSSGTPTEIRVTERYKFDGTAWSYEYDLNNSGFTSDQWAAINSTITSELVDKLNALPSNADLTAALGVLTNGIAAINEKIPTAATSSNKLVDTAAMQSYITQILNGIDATFNVTSTDGHVTIQVTQVNGVVTNVAVTTSDIASAADVAQLFQLYNALSQSEPEIIQPADTWPVANPSTTVIYRVIDRVNTPPQNYSDYMFSASDLTTPVLMATYNNAIDPRPKKGSQNLVTSGGVFDNMGALDVSELNATENPHTPAIYADLSAALAAITSDYQKGGMSIKFVQGSVQSNDNNYVQYRLMAQTFSIIESDWQGVDDTPIAGSENMIKSGGVYDIVNGTIVDVPSKWGLGQEVICRMATAQYISMNGYTARLVPINGGETIYAKGNSNGGGIAVVKTFSESSSWTAYDFATGEDARHSVPANNSTTFVCPSDAKLLIVSVKDDADKDHVPTELKINGTDVYSDTPSELSVVKEKVDNLEDVVYDKEYKWCGDDDFNNIIEEFYIPNALSVIGTGSYIQVIAISASGITLVIKTSSNDEIIRLSKSFNGPIDSNPDGSYDYYFGRKGKAAITTIYKKNSSNSLLERIGYIKFKDTTFAKTGTGAAVIDTSVVGNIDNSPTIKAMINDGRQLVLSGDSHFGAFKAQNILQDLLQGILGVQVYNVGFGGCRMAWRSSGGSAALDAYTFCDVIDAVLSGDFTKQRNSVDVSGDYPPQVANLEAIDTSKPMQWIVEYCVNDHTGGSPIGDVYEDDGTFNVSNAAEVSAKLSTFDRTTLLGALNYGLLKLYAAKPKLAEVQVTGGARVIDDPDAQGRRMRYNRQNTLGKTLDDYNKALADDCSNIGIRYADYPNNGLYNAFAMREGDEGITAGGSIHNNALGFCYMSKVIAFMSKYYLG